MVKLDEKAVVPEVDGAARERLTRSFDRDGVVAAMLIGSQARGNPGPLSDVDIAYWHDPGLDRDARRQLRLDLIAAAERALRTPEVDLVPLNEAPPLMQQRAIRDAVRLVERDRDERVRLETRALIEYFDTQPLRDALNLGMRRRIEEGRLVDSEPAGARLQRLEELLERLEEVREEGETAYLADAVIRAATERRLEMAVQICIDLGTQLATERSVRPPDSYADVFTKLAEVGLLTPDLAVRLSEAARQRNLLVHLYLEVDDRKVFAALESLDHLRAFAKVVETRLD